MANKKTKKRELDKRTATTWQKRHTTGISEQTKLWEKWKDYFDIMYAVKSTKNMAPWRSKIYIPILAGKAWDFIARLADITPRFVVDIRDEYELDPQGNPVYPADVKLRAEKISRKMAFDYENPLQGESPRDRVFSTLVDTVVTGTGIAKVSRTVINTKYRAHEAQGDEGDVNNDEEIIQEIEEGRNTYDPVSIFNVIFAPFTDSLQTAPWIIIDGFSTLDELNNAGVYDEQALAGIDADFRAGVDPTAQYSYHRNQLVASQDRIAADSSVNMLKTHECYERNEDGEVVIVTYVEGGNSGAGTEDSGNWIKIGKIVDPYWHNKYPLQTFYIRRKPYSIWGESLFENNETLQYASNDIFNHYMDNVNLSIDGMIMMDENAYVEDFVIAPGETLLYKNEQPKQFKFTEPDPGTISIVMNTLNKAVEDATVSSYATGTPNSESDKTQGTATGVRDIMGAAEEKMGFMRSNFKNSMLGMGEMWLIMDQQFMDRPVTIPTDTASGKVPTVITPLDLQGLITLTIDDDSMTPVSKSQQREQKGVYLTSLQGLAKASQEQAQTLGHPEDALRLDFRQLARDLSDVYGQSNYNTLVQPAPTPEEVQAMQAKVAAAAQPQEQPVVKKAPQVTVAYKDVAAPESKAAILMEAIPNYQGDLQTIQQKEIAAQTAQIVHNQTIDVLKNVPDAATPPANPAENTPPTEPQPGETTPPPVQ